MTGVSSSPSSPRNKDEGGLFSCWGLLKLKLPWTKKKAAVTATATRQSSGARCSDIVETIVGTNRRRPKPAGGFRYDPLSYAQNFDDGLDEDDEDGHSRGFSSRFAAAPSSKST